MHQLTGDFYTVGEILGHTLKGIGMSLGISTNLEAVTAQYVDVRLERKKAVLETYHKALHPQKAVPEKDAASKDAPKKTIVFLGASLLAASFSGTAFCGCRAL